MIRNILLSRNALTTKIGLFFLLFTFGSIMQIFGQDYYTSKATGEWTNPSTWTPPNWLPNTIPNNSQTVTIAAGHTVTYSGDLVYSQNITVNGTLIVTGNIVHSNFLTINSTGNLIVGGNISTKGFSISGKLKAGGNYISSGGSNTISSEGIVIIEGKAESNVVFTIEGKLLVSGNYTQTGGTISINDNGMLVVGRNFENGNNTVNVNNAGKLLVMGNLITNTLGKSTNAQIAVLGDLIIGTWNNTLTNLNCTEYCKQSLDCPTCQILDVIDPSHPDWILPEGITAFWWEDFNDNSIGSTSEGTKWGTTILNASRASVQNYSSTNTNHVLYFNPGSTANGTIWETETISTECYKNISVSAYLYQGRSNGQGEAVFEYMVNNNGVWVEIVSTSSGLCQKYDIQALTIKLRLRADGIKKNNAIMLDNIGISGTAICGGGTAPSTPDPISGPGMVCPSATGLVYSIPAVPNATTYNWEVPSGWTITSGSGTTSITVTSGIANGTITVTASNSGGTSNAQTIAVIVGAAPAIPSQPTAAQTQCIGGSFNSIAVTAGGSSLNYQWYSNTTTSNSGGDIITGATNSSYAPLATDVGTLYYYCVVTGSCGTATSTISGAFTVNPVASVASVTGSSPLCVGSTANYTANSVVLSGGTGVWSSSNTAVATVNSTTGLVTAVGAGTCSITYTITGGCGGTKTAQQQLTVSAPVGNPAVFGDNIWNVYAYQGNSIDLSGNNYKGYYTESNFSFSTISRWDINGSPDEATGYQGCQVTDNNHTFVYKREGFPSGTYQITIGHDDSFQLYIDDVLIDSHTTWDGNNPRVLTTFYPLNGSSKIEFRVAENAGGSRGALTFTPQCINPTDGGSVAAAQTICYGGDPAAFTSTGLPTGHAGTLEYKWQSSITGSISGFSDINPPATGLTYDVPSGLTQTTWYKRLARVSCAEWTEVASNVLEVTVRDNFSAGAIVTTGETICSGGTPATTIGSTTAASGGDNSVSYQWQSSADAAFTSPVTIISNTATYTPDQALTQATWYRRQAKDGACAVGFTSSANTWKVTVNNKPVPTFDPLPSEESCENDNESYTTQSGKLNYVWTIPGSIAGSDYTIISGGNATDNTMVLKWLTPGVKTVSVTYDDSNGCTGTVVSSTVTVHPIPEIGSFN